MLRQQLKLCGRPCRNIFPPTLPGPKHSTKTHRKWPPFLAGTTEFSRHSRRLFSCEREARTGRTRPERLKSRPMNVTIRLEGTAEVIGNALKALSYKGALNATAPELNSSVNPAAAEPEVADIKEAFVSAEKAE